MASLDSNITVTVELAPEDRVRIDELTRVLKSIPAHWPSAPPWTYPPPYTPRWQLPIITC